MSKRVQWIMAGVAGLFLLAVIAIITFGPKPPEIGVFSNEVVTENGDAFRRIVIYSEPDQIFADGLANAHTEWLVDLGQTKDGRRDPMNLEIDIHALNGDDVSEPQLTLLIAPNAYNPDRAMGLSSQEIVGFAETVWVSDMQSREWRAFCSRNSENGRIAKKCHDPDHPG